VAGGYVKLKEFKGVNLTDPPTLVQDDELVLSRNTWGVKRLGYLDPRPQQALYGTSNWPGLAISGGLTDLFADVSLTHFLDANSSPHIVAWFPNVGQVAGEVVGEFVLLNESLDGTTAKGINRPDAISSNSFYFNRSQGTPKKPTSLVFNNELYIFPGHTFPGLIIGANDLSSGPSGQPKFRKLGGDGYTQDSNGRYYGWALQNATTQVPFHPPFSFADVYRGIFVLGGLEPPYESLLFFTQYDDTPGTLLASPKVIGVGPGDGDKLINIKTIPVTGGAQAVEPYLIAFKQRSVWMIQGDPPTLTDDGTVNTSPVMRREGLIASHAICVTPYGVAWCSGRNVWLMPPGEQPTPIGNKIKGWLGTLPQFPSNAWFMEFHDDVLYLNTPSSSTLVDGRLVSGGQTLKYLPTQQMWCDLRKPDDPRWWGPMDVRAAHMTSLVATQGTHQLIGIAPVAINSAPAYVPFIMTDRADNKGRDLGDSGTLNGWDGNQVPASTFQDVRFREMDFGDDSLEKIVDGVEVNATWDVALGSAAGTSLSVDTPLGCSLVGDGGRENSAGTEPGQGLQTIGTNPASGTLLVQVNDSDNGSGGTYSAVLAGLGLVEKVARNISIDVAPTWLGGSITLIGTDLLGNAQTEVVSTASVATLGGTVVSTKYFRVLSNVTLASGGGFGVVANVNEGPATLTQDTATDPASTGFVLDQNTLDSGSLNSANLGETFIPLVFFPPNSSRFVCRTLQPRLNSVQVNDVASPATADDIRHRKFSVKSITPRVRPIGRRPGGSFGG
jgi:hypothetical protein